MVDDQDFEALLNYRWHHRKNGNTMYATTRFFVGEKIIDIDMHRAIMGILDPKILIDHKDGNGLNNQRSNLRKCNRSQNASNRHHPKTGKLCTSSYFGVCFMPSMRKWRAYITKDRKQISLGLHNKEEDAAKAYNQGAKKYHGEFAKLNKV
jgi:hypothetical protein